MNFAPLWQYMALHVALSDDEKEIIARHAKHRKYRKGQYIVQQGDVCLYESFVLKGCLRTFHVDKESQEHTVMFAIENWWTADLGSFLTQSPADYNVQCLEDTEVLQFSYDNLQALYNEVPKLERLFRVIVQNAYIAAEKRVIRNFSLSARERYEWFIAHYPQIAQRVPQYMIAAYLGITKEFLSKIRSERIADQ